MRAAWRGKCTPSTGDANPPQRPLGDQVLVDRDAANAWAFWKAFAHRFAWDFLPATFLHELYVQWMVAELPAEIPLKKCALTRRLKKVVTPETTSGEWSYTRCRAKALMRVAEPLTGQLPQWAPDVSDEALYGLRRNTTKEEPRS